MLTDLFRKFHRFGQDPRSLREIAGKDQPIGDASQAVWRIQFRAGSPPILKTLTEPGGSVVNLLLRCKRPAEKHFGIRDGYRRAVLCRHPLQPARTPTDSPGP